MTFKMTDNNVAAGLLRAYNRMNPNQYVREIYQNSVEAGATDIRLGKDQSALKSLNVERGCMIDNGEGIPFDHILDKINRINSSSKATGGVHENFGIGLKVSALPRNQYGLVIMCRTKEKPLGFMVWLHFDQGAAGARNLISEENLQAFHEDDETPLDYDYKVDFGEVVERGYASYTIDGVDYLSWWENNTKNTTGTAVIFNGDSPSQNTFDSFYSEGRSFLASRYLKYKVTPMAWRKQTRDRIGYEYNSMSDPIEQLNDTYSQLATIEHCGWKVKTFLHQKEMSHKIQRSSALIQKYFKEAIIYKNEIYGDFMDLTPQATKAVRNSWGIWSNKVGKKVTLLVYPPEFNALTGEGVFPDDSRTQVLWKDESKAAPTSRLPLDDLKAYYQKNMPEEIRDLLDEISLDELTTAKKSKIAQEISKWTKVYKDQSRLTKGKGSLVLDPKGDLFGSNGQPIDGSIGEANGQGGPNTGTDIDSKKPKEKTPEELEREAERKRAREQRKKAMNEPPTVIYKSQSDEEAEDLFKVILENGKESWEAAYYQPVMNGNQGNKLYINRDHPCFKSYVGMIQATPWIKEKNISNREVMLSIVEPYFEEHAPCSIMQIKGYTSPADLGSVLSPERLTQILTGHHAWVRREIKKLYKEFEKHTSLRWGTA